MPREQAEPAADPHLAATQVVSRFWQERSQGRQVSVDEVLGVPPTAADYLQTRATAIGMIARQAAEMAETPADFSEQVTAVGDTVRLATGGSLAGLARGAGGPIPQIEGYDLVGCLGRGGMGAVFEGYQQSTGRRVAVKFMLEGFDRSESLRRRFEREVEVVARLHHPGIVSVVDSGVRRGRYYYVMEYVAGRSLEGALDPGKCDATKAMELVAKVCDAVDYAHQRGVLHRDLKPSNIIVDDQGLPHLLDFGLAKTFDPGAEGTAGQRGLTVSGPDQLLGTVGYMSPEQAAGKHDEASVRTDVYSLGAIAYELLTGRLPCLMDGSLREVLNRIAQEDPPVPSSVRKKLGRASGASGVGGSAADLDAVLLRALEKSPARRYATAGELALELRRVIAGEPVEARRVGVAGRSWRWVNRNRTLSAVIAGAVITLAVVSSYLVMRVVSERDVARQTLAVLRGMMESVNPASGGKMTVVQLLDGAAKTLDASPPEQPEAEAEIRELLGNIYTKDGAYDKAIEHLEKTVRLLESQGRRAEPRLADALHKLGVANWWNGDYERAETAYQRSLDMRTRLHPSDNPDVALSLTHLAACRLRLGKLDESRQLYQRALEMRQRLYAGVNNGDHEEIAQALNALAKCDLESGQYESAERLFRQALVMIRRLKGDGYEGTAATSQNLGDCLLRRHEAQMRPDRAPEPALAAAAAEALDRALSIRRGIYPEGHHLVAASMIGLSRAELALGHTDRALELAQAGLKMYREKRRSDHPEFAEALRTLGAVQRARGEAGAACGSLEEALTVARATRPPAPGQIARILGELGSARIANGEDGKAEPVLEERFSIVRAMRPARAEDVRAAAASLVEFYTRMGKQDRAAPYQRFAAEH